MQTPDVRLDPRLNVYVWKKGIQGVQHKMRLRISRKRNEDEKSKEKLYSYVEPVFLPTVKGLNTVVIEEDE